MSQIKITGAPGRYGVEIDGRPTEVMSLDFHLDGSSLPGVTIRPPIFDVDVYVEGGVRIDDETVRTLRILGWTPPPDDGAKPEMDDDEFDRRLRIWIAKNPRDFRTHVMRLSRIQGDRPIRVEGR